MARDIFADLNDALFAQMDKLQSVDPRDSEQLGRTIEQSQAVSKLAQGIIDNNNSKISAMRFFDDAGVKAGALSDQHAKMLGGGGHGA